MWLKVYASSPSSLRAATDTWRPKWPRAMSSAPRTHSETGRETRPASQAESGSATPSAVSPATAAARQLTVACASRKSRTASTVAGTAAATSMSSRVERNSLIPCGWPGRAPSRWCGA